MSPGVNSTRERRFSSPRKSTTGGSRKKFSRLKPGPVRSSHHKSQHLRKNGGGDSRGVEVHRRLKVSRGAIGVERGLHTLRRHASAERKLRNDIAVAESNISVLSSELMRAAQSDAEAL